MSVGNRDRVIDVPAAGAQALSRCDTSATHCEAGRVTPCSGRTPKKSRSFSPNGPWRMPRDRLRAHAANGMTSPSLTRAPSPTAEHVPGGTLKIAHSGATGLSPDRAEPHPPCTAS